LTLCHLNHLRLLSNHYCAYKYSRQVFC